MILQSLAEFARRESLVEDPCFQNVGVTWAIEVGPNGEFRGVYDLRQESGDGNKKRRLPRQMLIPKRSKRTVQDCAEFLVDKPEYVLGIGDGPSKRRDKRRRLFLKAVLDAANATGSCEAQMLARFLDSEEARSQCAAELAARNLSKDDLICFRLAGAFLHDREDLKEYWRSQYSRKSVGSAQCLVCGNRAPLARLHPNIKPLAGAVTSGVPIVSFNAPAFESYGWDNNFNAPVCEDCAAAYTAALNRCLTDQFPDPADRDSKLPRQSHRLSDNLTAIYWSDDSHSGIERLADAAITEPEVARAILQAPWHGGAVTSLPLRFHCLLLQGAQGRATVRGYVADTIDRIRENIREWFVQTEVGTERAIPLRQLLAGLAVRRDKEGRRQRRRARREVDKLPPALAAEIYVAVLFGRPVPLNAVQAAVVRNRAESAVDHSRAALLQAWLSRNPAVQKRKTLVSLDPEHPSCAYQLGRLLAICESVQYGQRRSSPNRTVVDRYFPALSTRPNLVFAPLMRLTELHLSKLRTQGQLFWRARVAQVVDRLPAASLPAQLSLEDQALFALGFYHQRQANIHRGAAPAAADRDDNETEE